MDDDFPTAADEAIVRKPDTVDMPRLYDVGEFTKPKPGEKMHIDLHVVVEPIEGEMFKKKACVYNQLPGWGPWEIISDEGVGGGGGDTAPSPLAYFSAGAAFCLSTHIVLTANMMNVTLKHYRVEQHIKFTTTFSFHGTAHPSDFRGAGALFETHVHIETDDAEEDLPHFMEWCKQACMAGQTISNPVPTKTVLHFNGQQIEA